MAGIFGRSSLGVFAIESPVCDTNSPDFNADMCYTGPFPGDGQGHPLPKKTGGDAQGPCPNGSYVNPATGKCTPSSGGGGGKQADPRKTCPVGQVNVAGVCVSVPQECPPGTTGKFPACVPQKDGWTTPSLVTGDVVGQGSKPNYTLPIVLGAGLLVLAVGSYFLLREPTPAVARANKKRRSSRLRRNEWYSRDALTHGEAGGWYKQEVGARTHWFWAITPQKKANSFSGISVEESGGHRPKAIKNSVSDWRLWTKVKTGDVPRYVLHVADEKLLELSFKKR